MVKSTPHIILMLGVHTPGIEKSIEQVMLREKPAALAVEWFGDPSESARRLRELTKHYETLVRHPDPGAAAHAQVYRLAKNLGVSFHPAESYTHADYSRLARLVQKAEELVNEAMREANQGDLEAAIKKFQEAHSYFKISTKERDEHIATNIAKLAREKHIVALAAGAGHAWLAKVLQGRGVKVTLYHAGQKNPLPMPQAISSSKPFTRTQAIRLIFNTLLGNYLEDRYSLPQRRGILAFRGTQQAQKLSRIPASDIEEFIRQNAGKTPVGQRQHFLDFCQRHKVRFPNKEGMYALSVSAAHPEFRRVKVFEPFS